MDQSTFQHARGAMEYEIRGKYLHRLETESHATGGGHGKTRLKFEKELAKIHLVKLKATSWLPTYKQAFLGEGWNDK